MSFDVRVLQTEINSLQDLAKKAQAKRKDLLKDTTPVSGEPLAKNTMPTSQGTIVFGLNEKLDFNFLVKLDGGGSYRFFGHCVLDKQGIPNLADYKFFITETAEGFSRHCRKKTKKSNQVFFDNQAEILALATMFANCFIKDEVAKKFAQLQKEVVVKEKAAQLAAIWHKIDSEIVAKHRLIDLLQLEFVGADGFEQQIDAI